jgi:GT2 family glycosyltransferase
MVMACEPVRNRVYSTVREPELSVLVTTYNRSAAVGELLESLASQDLARERFEVLVLDDGSRPEEARAVRRLVEEREWPFALMFLEQTNAGPATARNRLVQRVRGQWALFLNDDVVLNRGHLSTHLAVHARNPEGTVAVRGTTVWPPVGRDNAVMRHLRSKIFRYDFDLAPGQENWVYFHTCDLSLRREVLLDEPFDEGFRYPAYEDTELGYRLYKKRGLRLILTPEAVSTHRHDYGARDLIRRGRMMGRAAWDLMDRHPELTEALRDHYYTVSRRRRMLWALGFLVTLKMENFWEQVELILYLRNLERAERER